LAAVDYAALQRAERDGNKAMRARDQRGMTENR
jgi:hypothetical protein